MTAIPSLYFVLSLYHLDIVFAFIFGVVFGSFSSFIGFRLFNDDKRFTVTGLHSACCSCGHKLSIPDLIPIISFLLLRGKCRYCGARIPIWHFLAELILGIAFAYAVHSANGINIVSICLCIIFWCITTQSIIDTRVLLSSDAIHLITLIAAIVFSISIGNSWQYILSVVLSGIAVFITLSFVMKFFLKKDCIGFGDVKLFTILSITLSPIQISIFMTLSGVIGILYFVTKSIKITQNSNRSYNLSLNFKNQPFPFIPAISIAFLLAFYFKIEILQ